MPRQTLANVAQAGTAPRPSHPLRALLIAQFLGAFNDNVQQSCSQFQVYTFRDVGWL